MFQYVTFLQVKIGWRKVKIIHASLVQQNDFGAAFYVRFAEDGGKWHSKA
jgi:hypothetical protein